MNETCCSEVRHLPSSTRDTQPHTHPHTHPPRSTLYRVLQTRHALAAHGLISPADLLSKDGPQVTQSHPSDLRHRDARRHVTMNRRNQGRKRRVETWHAELSTLPQRTTNSWRCHVKHPPGFERDTDRRWASPDRTASLALAFPFVIQLPHRTRVPGLATAGLRDPTPVPNAHRIPSKNGTRLQNELTHS